MTKKGEKDRYYIGSTIETRYCKRINEHIQGQDNSSYWVKKHLQEGFIIEKT